ncbi:MAG: diguanylate cyclase [Methylococcales bacterium]|nr:diguanylate cyclase [Methylococcales bacterium]MDD5215232.1 diguanylate cyclase [Methylococcales bacterium]
MNPNQNFNFHELKTSNRLPSPSGTALEIMKLLQRDDAEISDVIKLVKLDPALTGRILQFANSAAAGAHRSVTNIADAVMMMGMSAVKNFALSLSLVGNNNDNRCPNFDYATYWSKSLATGVAISALSARERVISAEEAFTLGLLLRIGLLALATAWSESYGECLALTKNDEAALLKLEQERFAITHRELSVMLLADWGFSDLFLEGLKLSYEPVKDGLSKANRLAKQLVFAEKVANYCLADEAYREILRPDLVVDAANNSFDEVELDAFLEDVLRQWQEWGKSINVKTDIRQSSPELGAGKNMLSGLNILVVDDDVMMLARLSKQLTAAGHKVAASKDGDSALKYALEHKPDLIITNWHMKPMDGITLSKTLHSSIWGSSIYIIMLTSTEEESALIEAFNAGIDDYVTTPISLKVLLARIRAGQRIITLQQEVEKERKDLQRYIAELAVANRRLELMANTDVLTGLSNRRYSLNRLEQEWASAQRNKRPLSVLMLDLDHFKSVNDTFGHDAGDLVLIQAAKIIKKCVRATDIPCRLGGEEFLVILPNTDSKEAILLAERIRKMIEANQANVPLTKPMTVSIGAACSNNGKTSGKELITLADDALYAVKRERRNAVKLAQ